MMEVRHRKGYAATIREDSIPAYLMIVLGTSAPSFCRHQALYTNFMSTEGRRNPILIALEKGRKWRNKALKKSKRSNQPESLPASRGEDTGPPTPSPDSLIANQIQDLRQKLDDLEVQQGGTKRSADEAYNKEMDIAGKVAMQFSEFDSVFQREKSRDELGAPSKLLSMISDSRLLMQMHANRANARWVEEEAWVAPHVYDPKIVFGGRSDILAYRQIAKELLEQGKVALQLIDAGQDIPVKLTSGEIGTQSILVTDIWKPVQDFYPWKIGRLAGHQSQIAAVHCRHRKIGG
eukprot:evm.model.scf_3969.1 EVM.evm.TU.scf_3969.1   scf_3969:2586-5851(+)